MWRGRYRDAANRTQPLARISLETLTSERVEIYNHVLPTGQPNPIEVAPFPVDDNIPEEEEIAKLVLWLKLHRTGGPSGMSSEHLRMWFWVATREEDPSPGNREKIVAIIQVDFRGGELEASCAWQMVMMIYNGVCTDFRGIGLEEVL